MDFLLSESPAPDSPLRERVDWFIDLIQWIRVEGPVRSQLDFSSGTPQAQRVRWILHILDKNPEWKIRVQKTLVSILHHSQATELFVSTGISHRSGLWSEALDRLQTLCLPTYFDEKDLISLVSQTFTQSEDALWIQHIDTATFIKILQLWTEHIQNRVNPISLDLQTALRVLALQISGFGLDKILRDRLNWTPLEDNAFFLLPKQIEDYLASTSEDSKISQSVQIKVLIHKCFANLVEVSTHMDEHGVNIGVVFHLEKTDACLRRLETLIDLSLPMDGSGLTEIRALQIQSFIAMLAEENFKSRRLRTLFSDNTQLLARKIVETSADTGEHYLARNSVERKLLFKSALGGGALTGLTTFIKIICHGLPLPLFGVGLVNSMNYSLSFLSLQALGFSLATKQPAMTAATLAQKMKANETAEISQEVIHLIRSQITAVVGNILAVIPVMVLIGFAYAMMSSESLLSPEYALKTAKGFALLGPTPVYAALTGCLLFASSLFAGWFYNWMIERKIPKALAQNRAFLFAFGARRSQEISDFVHRHSAAIAANVSLGFLLGMSPIVSQFLGLPFDVRHVTLSTGSLTAAVLSLGFSFLSSWAFWNAVLGILSMGALNILVSFALAMSIALKSQKVSAARRKGIYKTVLIRVLKNPRLLFQTQDESS